MEGAAAKVDHGKPGDWVSAVVKIGSGTHAGEVKRVVGRLLEYRVATGVGVCLFPFARDDHPGPAIVSGKDLDAGTYDTLKELAGDETFVLDTCVEWQPYAKKLRRDSEKAEAGASSASQTDEALTKDCDVQIRPPPATSTGRQTDQPIQK